MPELNHEASIPVAITPEQITLSGTSYQIRDITAIRVDLLGMQLPPPISSFAVLLGGWQCWPL